MKRLILVRHGECVMNLHTKTTIGGQSNASPLTALGVRQAAALGRRLAATKAPPPPVVFASTAVRAADTARLLLDAWCGGGGGAADAPDLVQSEQLLELSQGSWEGAPRSECYTPEVLACIAADPLNWAAPGGESQRQLEARVAAYVEDEVLPRAAAGGPPAVVVSHGLAIKCFLRRVLQSDPAMTWKIRLDNTSVTEVGWQEGGAAAGWHVLRVNDTAHLALAGLSGAAPE